MKMKLRLPGGAELSIERQKRPLNPQRTETICAAILLGLPPVVFLIFALVLVRLASGA